MSETTKSNCKNFFKTNDEVKRKTAFNQRWIEIINLCEKATKEKNKWFYIYFVNYFVYNIVMRIVDLSNL